MRERGYLFKAKRKTRERERELSRQKKKIGREREMERRKGGTQVERVLVGLKKIFERIKEKEN